MDWFNELQRQSVSPENALRLQDAFSQIDVTALLPQVSVPTLVLHGVGDGVVPFAEGKMMAEGIPGARFVPLLTHNHIMLADEPACGLLHVLVVIPPPSPPARRAQPRGLAGRQPCDADYRTHRCDLANPLPGHHPTRGHVRRRGGPSCRVLRLCGSRCPRRNGL